MRSGRQYTDALRDDRRVYLAGTRVPDVTDHPAFAAAIQTVASLYDIALDPANDIQFSPADGTGGPANKAFMIPRSGEDLRARRLASTRLAQVSHGFIGRGPDHVAGFLDGLATIGPGEPTTDQREPTFGAQFGSRWLGGSSTT